MATKRFPRDLRGLSNAKKIKEHTPKRSVRTLQKPSEKVSK